MIKGAFEDSFLQKELYKILDKYNIDTIVETGTYKGWSTNVLAKTGKKIITIEINPSYYNEAKNFNQHNKNIKFYLGTSQEVLKEILSNNQNNDVLFFLDAHWEDYWPILDELRVIKEKKLKPIIIIHDFFVPNGRGGSNLGYDQYKGQPLDYFYVKQEIEDIYGDKYEHYCLEESEINAGVGIFVPKI